MVRSRLRWAATDAAKQQRKVAAKLLEDMGVIRDELVALARAGLVEVSTQWMGERWLGLFGQISGFAKWSLCRLVSPWCSRRVGRA